MKTLFPRGIASAGAALFFVVGSTAIAGKPSPTPQPTSSPWPSATASPVSGGGGRGGKKNTPTPTPTSPPASTPIDGRTDWNGTTSSDFNTASNWTPNGGTPGSAPPVAGDVAWFTSTPTNKAVNLSSSVSLAGLYFNGTGAFGYTLTSSSTSFNYALTATATAIGAETGDTTAVAIGAENTSGTNTIAAGISLAPVSGSASTIYQAGGGTLAFTQGRENAFSTTTGIDLKNNTLVFTGAGDFVIGPVTPTGFGTIYNSVAGNSTALIMGGTGTLSLNDVNTYTGDTIIKSGTVLVGASDALGNFLSSQILLGDTTGSSNATLATTTVVSIGNTITIQSGNSGTIRLGSESDLTNNFVSLFSGNIFLGSPGAAPKSATFAAGVGDFIDFSGVIDENAGATSQTGSVIIGDATHPGGISFSNGNNLYGGTTTIGFGVFLHVIELGTSGGSSIGNSDRTNPANLIIDGATLSYIGFSADTTTRSFTVGPGGATVNSDYVTGEITFSSSATVAHQGTGNRTFTLGGISTLSNTFGAVIGDPGGGGITSFNKDGVGFWALTGANTYTGATTINGGTLQLGDGGTSGSLSTSSVIIDNGNFAVNRSDTVTQGIHFNGAGIGGLGSFTQSGTGTTVLNAANSYGGGTTVNDGILKLSGAGTLGSTSGTLTMNGGTLDLNATSQTVGGLNGAGGTVLNSAASTTSTLVIDANMPASYSGTLAVGTGVLALTKTGGATQTLSGNNTYSGTTRINDGTLVAQGTGSLGGTADIEVNPGGTLLFADSGTTDRINDSATVFLNGGTINTAGLSEGAAGAPGIGALTLQSSAIIDLSSGASILAFADSTSGVWAAGNTLSIYNWSGNASGNGTDQLYFGTNTSGLTSTQLAQIGFYSDEGTTFLGFGAWAADGDGEVVPAPIPEPSTWIGAALGLGVVSYSIRRRKVRRA